MRAVIQIGSICMLSACIAPLPVESVDDPWVQGVVLHDGVAVSAAEVSLNHKEEDACDNPALQTLTDDNGRFEFEGKLRTWTWLGWANNHYVHGCIRVDGEARRFGTIAVSDPGVIQFDCDIARPLQDMCVVSCGDDEFGGRC